MTCNENHAIRIAESGHVYFSGYQRYPSGKIKGYEDWIIKELEGHPKSSIFCVAESYFAKLHIPAEHKFKLLYPLPRPAKSDSAMVAFYPDENKRKAQVLTVMKPGRYLRKTLVDDDGNCLYPDTKIEEWANAWIVEYGKRQIHYLTKADDIVDAYVKSRINSCMSHDIDSYASRPHHPVEVYGTADDGVEVDTQLAVIYESDDDIAPENIIARCIVYPKEKIRTAMYGDYQKIMMLLEKDGYTTGSFEGARLRKIENDSGQIVCPYFDFGCGVAEDKVNLVVRAYGSGGESQNGLLHGSQCCECGDSIDPDDTWSDDDENEYCENCYHDIYRYCNVIGEHVRDDGDFIEINGTVRYDGLRIREVSQEGIEVLLADNLVFWCELTEDYYSCESYVRVETVDGDVCEYESLISSGGFHCEITDECYSSNYEFHVIEPGVVVLDMCHDGNNVDDDDKERYVKWLSENNYKDDRFEMQVLEYEGQEVMEELL